MTIERRSLARFEPVDFDDRVIALVEEVAQRAGLVDAAHAVGRRARRADARPGVPGGDGVRAERAAASATTRPSYTDDADLEAGANVLLHVLAAAGGRAMTRPLTVAAAQMGPVARRDTRASRWSSACS